MAFGKYTGKYKRKPIQRVPLSVWLCYALVLTMALTGITLSGYVSSASDQDAARVAGPVSIQITQVKLPSFEVVDISTRLIHTEDLSDVLMVEFRTMDATMVTVEMQKKIGAEYVTQTTILESVNGKTAADAGQGVFFVDINPMTLGLSASTPTGTYRLLFRIYNDNGSIEVPYNFIVAE